VCEISAGRTHSAAWTCPAPVRRSHGATTTLQLGTPTFVPAQYTALQECSVEDIRARLQLLHGFSDLVYSSWRLLSLVRCHVCRAAPLIEAALEMVESGTFIGGGLLFPFFTRFRCHVRHGARLIKVFWGRGEEEAWGLVGLQKLFGVLFPYFTVVRRHVSHGARLRHFGGWAGKWKIHHL